MDIKEEKICRLCLNKAGNKFEAINETKKNMLDFLLPEMNLDISKDPVICHECSETANRCFYFKSALMSSNEGENKPKIKLEIEPVAKEVVNRNVYEDLSICRCCTVKLERNKGVSMNCLSFADMLPTVIPEMDFDGTKDPTVCTYCKDNLECYLKFVTDYQDVEKNIYEYCQYNKTSNGSYINLNDILLFLTVDVPEYFEISELKQEPETIENVNLHNDHIKNEELDIKIEVIHQTPENNPEAKMLTQEETKPRSVLTSNKKRDCESTTISSKTQMYKCDICTYVTKKKHNFDMHLIVHKDPSEVEMHKCTRCTYETKFKYALKRHMLVHKGTSEVEMYKCNVCAYQTKYKYYMKMHKLNHRNSSEDKMYKCEVCPFETKFKQVLPTHLLTHKDPLEREVYKCATCNYETKYKQSLRYHMSRHTNFSAAKMHKCTLCSYEDKHKNCLKDHIRLHNGFSSLNTYKCTDCTYEATCFYEFRAHLVVHNGTSKLEIYKCTMCTYETKHNHYLHQHILTHKDPSELKIYKCIICGFQTKWKCYLDRHLLAHKDPLKLEMHKCTMCNYETKRKANLIRHVRTHTVASTAKCLTRKYKCTTCSFESRYKYSLENHVLLHKKT